MSEESVPAEQPDPAVEALLAASRLMTAVVSHSLARPRTSVTTPQLRVLVMLHTRGELTLGSIARGLDVNASNASRTCDQLVTAKLVLRRTGREDRRNVVLRLSAKGAALVERSMAHRRALFAQILDEVDPADRDALARGLGALLDVAERASTRDSLRDHDADPMPWLT